MKHVNVLKSVIWVLLVFAILDPTSGYSSSVELLRSQAKLRHQKLLKCIVNNNNDATLCIDKLNLYVEAVNKLKTGELKDNDFNKTIKFIEKSLFYYYKKAVATNDIKYYDKAEILSASLLKVSPKSIKYKDILSHCKNRKKGSKVSTLLDHHLNKLLHEKSANKHNINKFTKLLKAGRRYYKVLNTGTKNNIVLLANNHNTGLVQHLNRILSDIKSKKIANFINLNYKLELHDYCKIIPGATKRNKEIVRLTREVNMLVDQYMTHVHETLKSIKNNFISSEYGGFSKSVTKLNIYNKVLEPPIKYITVHHFDNPNWKKYPAFIKNLIFHNNYYSIVLKSVEKYHGGQYEDALKYSEDALIINMADSAIHEKVIELRLSITSKIINELHANSIQLVNDHNYSRAYQLLRHNVFDSQYKQLQTTLTKKHNEFKIRILNLIYESMVAIANKLLKRHSYVKAYQILNNSSYDFNSNQTKFILDKKSEVSQLYYKHITQKVESLFNENKYDSAYNIIADFSLPIDAKSKSEIASLKEMAMHKSFLAMKDNVLIKLNLNDFNVAKRIIDSHTTPVLNSDKNALQDLNRQIYREASKYFIKLASKQKKSGYHMNALRTIYNAKMWIAPERFNSEFHKLRLGFDYSEVQTYDDAMLLMNCNYNIISMLTYPKKAINQICENVFRFVQQIDSTTYRGYFNYRGSRPNEVVIKILYKNAIDAVLEDKDLVVVFRVAGVTKLKRVLSGGVVTIPLLEAIYIK